MTEISPSRENPGRVHAPHLHGERRIDGAPAASAVPVLDIPTNLLDPPESLARPVDQGEYYAGILDSLRSMGQLDPIIVERWKGRYRIIDGMHRFVAAQEMGWTSLRAQVFDKENLSVAAIQLHANQVHKEMTPWEEYRFFTLLIERLGLDFEGVCRHVHKSEDYVSTRLLIAKLTPETQKALETDQITLSLACQLMRVKDPVWERYWLELCLKSGSGAKVLRGWITQWQMNQTTPSPADAAAAIQPQPAPPPVPDMVCGLCGMFPEGRLMVQVWCHTDELQMVSAVVRGVDRSRAAAAAAPPPPAGGENEG